MGAGLRVGLPRARVGQRVGGYILRVHRGEGRGVGSGRAQGGGIYYGCTVWRGVGSGTGGGYI